MVSAVIPRFDRKLEHILSTSAELFARNGFHSSSMRDISRATGVSLSGLYHYCQSKDELLFLILFHSFSRVSESVLSKLQISTDPVERLRIFINNHISFFVANMAEMKVAAIETESLKPEMRQEIDELKNRYANILKEILRSPGGHSNTDVTIATYSLFGMMNWIFNWYDRNGKLKSTELADRMTDLFINGYMGNNTFNRSSKPLVEENPRVWRALDKA
jgi:TetR/AcrR family transcriptional regulator, cholesterol catabolism regulator